MTATAPSIPTRFSRLPSHAIGSVLTLALLNVTAVSILLAAAQSFALSSSQTTTLIVAVFGATALCCIGLTMLLHQPIVMGLNVTGFLFTVSLASTYSYSQIVGGVLVGGILVIALTVIGVSGRLAALIPAPIIFGVVAGAVMPFIVGIFTDLNGSRAMIGLTVVAFLLARRFLPPRIPPILPAVLVGFLVAGWSGSLHGIDDWALPTTTTVTPSVSWQAILSIAPVIAILIVANSSVAAIVYMRSEGYDPPECVLNLASGIATMLGSFFGPIPIGPGAWVVALVAGPEAGPRPQRNWASYSMGAGVLVLALCAGMAAQVPNMIPTSLLLALAGLALIAVLGQALGEMTKGPLRLGPLFAFVVASSGMSIGGFGPAFWALVIGLCVTLLMEQGELQAMRATTGSP